MKNQLSAAQVQHVAQLANIPIADQEATKLAVAFAQTLDYVTNLKELDTTQVEPTHQATGLENVLRDDIVDTERMFTQAQALANAPRAHQGYFVVNQVISKGD